jgi:sec-independent protein translocase protein TatB
MFDIGWTELLLIGIVALIVVGPKDLPIMFHTLGRFTAKARSMAREFTRAMDDAAKESGVGDIAKDLKNMTSARNLGLDKVKDAATKFEKWDPMKPSAATTAKGPATAALSEERAAVAEKIRDASAKKATERLAAEAAAKAAADAPKPASNGAKAPAGKPRSTAKEKPSAKPKATTAAKKTVSKPAARKTTKKAAE